MSGCRGVVIPDSIPIPSRKRVLRPSPGTQQRWVGEGSAESRETNGPLHHGVLVWILAVVVVTMGVPWVVAEEPSHAGLSPRALEALRLVGSGDEYQQQLGFLRLEALRDPSTVPAILPYASHKNPDLRAESLRALAAIQGGEAVGLLLDRMRHDKHPHVRRAAILGIEPYVQTSPEIVPALIAALRDRDTTVRMSAVDVVSRINDPRARQAILTRYRREGRRDVRRVLEMAMKRLGTK